MSAFIFYSIFIGSVVLAMVSIGVGVNAPSNFVEKVAEVSFWIFVTIFFGVWLIALSTSIFNI